MVQLWKILSTIFFGMIKLVVFVILLFLDRLV